MTGPLAALHESGNGANAKCRNVFSNVRFRV